MKGIIRRIIGALLPGILFLPGAAAQPPAAAWRDFGCVRNSEAWLSGSNPSGLTRLPDSLRISFAEVFAEKNNGGFVNYHQSDNAFAFGAQTESLFRLNRRVVFYGHIAYTNFTGQNMSGAAALHPDGQAFNFVEPDGSHSGEKGLEQYRLVGAAGIRLSPRWSLGGKVDYLTANYTKYRDLRHQNLLLDMTATMGASFQVSRALAVGVNYHYRRSIESILFGIYGTTGATHSTLIDFGAFYGHSERFGEDGYTKEINPAVDRYHGGSLQIDWAISPRWRFYHEFSGALRAGYYGNRSTEKIVFTEHEGTELAYAGTLSFAPARHRHFLRLHACYAPLENHENAYKKIRVEQMGRTEVVYTGSAKVLDRTRAAAGIAYTAWLQVNDYCPAWELQAGADFSNRRQTTTIYPFYREQNLYRWNAHLSACRRLTVRNNQYGISLQLLYGAGSGDARHDGVYATPSESSRRPTSADYHLLREHEFLTAARATGTIGCRYARLLRPKTSAYVRLNYAFTNAFQTTHLPAPQHHAVTVAVGCEF